MAGPEITASGRREKMSLVAYDALLWLSFGGPEGPDEVMPFLENVTRGRGVPRERLEEVAEHYYHFDGVSPINRLNREAIAALESRLAADGVELPVYFGNRNWQPYVEDTVRRMADDGVRSALVLATSAYGGYSASTQYDEDILRAREAVGEKAPELVKLRQFGDHPLFVEAVADGIRTAWQGMPPRTRVVFTAHSIPVSADEKQWPGDDAPHRYTRQVAEASRLVAAELGVDDYDVVWQSRSGPPSVPWLEPDIVDHLDTVAESGARGVVVSPIGFIAPHLEVVWDLDNEAAERAAELGLTFARAATAGEDPRFARLVAELIAEHADGDAALAPRRLSDIPAEPISINGTPR